MTLEYKYFPVDEFSFEFAVLEEVSRDV